MTIDVDKNDDDEDDEEEEEDDDNDSISITSINRHLHWLQSLAAAAMMSVKTQNLKIQFVPTDQWVCSNYYYLQSGFASD